MSVIEPGHVIGGLPQGGFGFFLSLLDSLGEVRGLFHGSSADGLSAKVRVLSRVKAERSLLSHGVDPIVVCKFCNQQPFGPVILPVTDKYLEELLNLLVDTFRLTISLWVVSSGDISSNTKEFVQFRHKLGCECGTLVADDNLWKTMVLPDIVSEEVCDAC